MLLSRTVLFPLRGQTANLNGYQGNTLANDPSNVIAQDASHDWTTCDNTPRPYTLTRTSPLIPWLPLALDFSAKYGRTELDLPAGRGHRRLEASAHQSVGIQSRSRRQALLASAPLVRTIARATTAVAALRRWSWLRTPVRDSRWTHIGAVPTANTRTGRSLRAISARPPRPRSRPAPAVRDGLLAWLRQLLRTLDLRACTLPARGLLAAG